MADDFTAQVKKVAMAMGASLSDQDIGRIPREVRMQGECLTRCINTTDGHTCRTQNLSLKCVYY